MIRLPRARPVRPPLCLFAFSRLVYQGFKVRRLYLQCTCKFPLRDCFASCSQTFLYRDALYFIATCTSFRLNNSLRPYGPHPRVCKIIRQCYSTMLQYQLRDLVYLARQQSPLEQIRYSIGTLLYQSIRLSPLIRFSYWIFRLLVQDCDYQFTLN